MKIRKKIMNDNNDLESEDFELPDGMKKAIEEIVKRVEEDTLNTYKRIVFYIFNLGRKNLIQFNISYIEKSILAKKARCSITTLNEYVKGFKKPELFKIKGKYILLSEELIEEIKKLDDAQFNMQLLYFCADNKAIS